MFQYLEPAEQAALYRVLHASTCCPFDTFIMLLFETGMRVSESLTLSEEDLSPSGVLSIAPLKGSNPRRVALSPGLQVRLRRLPRHRWSEALVKREGMTTTLASRKRVLCRHYHKLTKRVLCRRLNLHSLRHAAITRLYEATKDVVMTQQWAGQASISSTMIYVHQMKQKEANDRAQLLLKSFALRAEQ